MGFSWGEAGKVAKDWGRWWELFAALCLTWGNKAE